MLDDLPREEVHDAVDRAVEELLNSAGIAVPPVDAIQLALRHLGMDVCLDREQKQRGRAQRASGKPLIYLRPEPREERHQWTVAHEIGEHLKTEIFAKFGMAPENIHAYSGESLANLFAYRLLVPSRWFASDAADCDFDLLELKRRYRTASHEVIAWRMLDLPSPCVMTIVDNGRIHKRRSNAFRIKSRQMEKPELQCQQRVHATGEACRLRQGDWTVQGWPVHQMDWKREILRSVRDVD